MSTSFFERVASDLVEPPTYPEEFLRHIDEAGFDGIGDFLVHYALGDLDTVEDLDDFLAHYGVMGMKWGVRNADSARRTGKPKSRKALRKAAADKSKSSTSNRLSDKPQNRRMTDAEMRNVVARLRLEKELSQLTGSDRAPESRVKKLLQDVAYDVAKGAATEVGKQVLAHALKTQYNQRASEAYKLPTSVKKKKD